MKSRRVTVSLECETDWTAKDIVRVLSGENLAFSGFEVVQVQVNVIKKKGSSRGKTKTTA